MPRSPEDNRQIKDARRSDILRAATRVFAKKGFTDAKISDVAKEAGLSHGLVYHYFQNKDELFAAILDDKLCRAREAMAEDESIAGTALDRMRATLANWLERVQAEPETSLVITQALLSNTLSPETRAKMRDHMRESYRTATERLAEGQRRGEISTHAPPAELASAIMCMMRGIAFSRIVDYGPDFVVPGVDTLARLMMPGAMLAGNGARPSRVRRRGTTGAKELVRGQRTLTSPKSTPRKASR
jgi:AcrR family transcriptional regulator